MGTEVLNIPEESVPDVVRVIRAGLATVEVPAEVGDPLRAWCATEEAFGPSPGGAALSRSETEYLGSLVDAGLDAWGAEFDLGHLASVREHNFEVAKVANNEHRARRAGERRRRAAIVRSAKRCPGCHRMVWPSSPFASEGSVFSDSRPHEHLAGCPHDPAPQRGRTSEAAGA